MSSTNLNKWMPNDPSQMQDKPHVGEPASSTHEDMHLTFPSKIAYIPFDKCHAIPLIRIQGNEAQNVNSKPILRKLWP